MKRAGVLLVSAAVVLLAAVSALKIGSERTWRQAWDDVWAELADFLGL